MFDTETHFSRQRGRRSGQGRALPLAERAARSREHLPRHSRGGSGKPAGAHQPDPGADRPDSRRTPARLQAPSAAIGGLETAYDRAYYSGIAWERRAKARS